MHKGIRYLVANGSTALLRLKFDTLRRAAHRSSSKGTGCDSPVPERSADSFGPGTLPVATGRAGWDAELTTHAGSGCGRLGDPSEG